MTTQFKTGLYWIVGAVALIALAGTKSFGSFAVFLTVILIAGVLLTHWQDYVGLFSPPK